MHADRRRFVAAALAGAVIGRPALARAGDYPDKPVRLVVPFPPGGSVDYVGRTLVAKLGENLGQTVYIDNRGGASGTIGTYEVTRAAPDGYTLLLVFDSHAVNQTLYKGLKYDTLGSLDYLSLIGTMPVVLMTSKRSGLDTLPKLIAAAKARPGAINVGNSGVGGSNHLNAVAFEAAAGIKLSHVPYKGGGPMLTAVLGGEVDVVIASLPTVVGFIKARQVNALGVSTPEPVPQLPDVPPIAASLPGYKAQSWVGLVGPHGLPANVRDKVAEALAKTLADPSVRDKLAGEGFNVVGGSPKQFEDFVRAESRRLGDLIHANGITLD